MTARHPYLGKPDYQFWKKEPGISQPRLFDPVTSVSFKITDKDPVVTAGSCFAQHVAKHLAASGFDFLVTERPHALMWPELAAKMGYGLFTARYGNVYTARQLKQLLQRAYGLFEPIETFWPTGNGAGVDPFRPQIQEGGFVSREELDEDRRRHFKAIRQAISSLSVFVFTLGLTEAWADRRDGTVFPIAPGVAGGEFDEDRFHFQNYTVDEIVDDMRWSLNFIRGVNPAAKFIITVSPVPLNATAVDRHVFVSTTYSKAVLRVAAEKICSSYELCDYFPSFEIITSPYTRGAYYGPDCRGITEAGVSHVMSLFLKHYGDRDMAVAPVAAPGTAADAVSEHFRMMSEVVEVLCDEERISN